jgi:succinate-acetate transporter protein
MPGAKQQQQQPHGGDDAARRQQARCVDCEHAASAPATPKPPLSSIAIANAKPAPRGLLAFGVTTCLLMFRTAGWAEQAHVGLVLCYAFSLGGLCQLIAGVCDLFRGDVFGGTAFSLYGAFWVGWGLLQLWAGQEQGPVRSASAFRVGETLFLGVFALLTAGLLVPTLRRSAGLVYVFASLTATFALLAGGVWSAPCATAAGYVGLLCGAGAIAVAFATLYKETLGWDCRLVRPIRLV